LDGEYNEQESHAAFQKALSEWRRGPSPVPTKLEKSLTRSDSVGQSTEESGTQSTQSVSEAEKRLQELLTKSSTRTGLSYLDKVLLNKYRQTDSLENSTPLTERQEELNILAEENNKQEDDEQSEAGSWNDEEEEEESDLQQETFPKVDQDEDLSSQLTLQDITLCEAAAIQESLLAGRMIEVLPSKACRVEEPLA
jgi:hypothetical protein